MSNRLFVGNLSYGVGEDALRDAFARVGAVSSTRVVTDPVTGRSRGFAFVEMESDDLAEAAIRQLDGADLDGRPIRVDRARSRRPSAHHRPA